MTAQTAAKRITRRLGGIESETLADVQQAIDEAVKEERERYAKLAARMTADAKAWDDEGEIPRAAVIQKWRNSLLKIINADYSESLTGGSP